jgi:hypothetical protein
MDWLAQRPGWLLTIATLLALAPFLSKPFNIDDPLFIWVARHIQSHPSDPYGFNVNWYGYDWPVWDITKNPPLACYYLSAAGKVLGWSEWALHAAFLLPAMAAVVGTQRLAARFCSRPVFAALLTLFTPVFVVSATTVMCDVCLLAFWVWSLVFWMEGVERGEQRRLAFAALLMALAALTKYFGACLIPLVAIWSVGGKRSIKGWIGWLLAPIGALAAYQFATSRLYGHGLLADAAEYAGVIHESSVISTVRSLVSGLAFAGACLAPGALFAPLLWRARQLVTTAAACLIVVGMLCFIARDSFPIPLTDAEVAQILFWAAGGTGLLALAIADFRQRRDADSLLLGCWLLGTFFFAAFCNWVINGRSILPMTVPAAIFVMRRLERREKEGAKFSRAALFAPGIAGAIIAVWVSVGDYSFSLAQKVAAEAVCAGYRDKGHRLWFQGHWGFQYYMEAGGASAMDLHHPNLTAGDYIAMPSRNTNVEPLREPVDELETFSVPVTGGVTTMYKPAGSGFYASIIGPLPFAWGPMPTQVVKVFQYDPTGELQRQKPGNNAAQ